MRAPGVPKSCSPQPKLTHTGSHVDAPLHKVPGGRSISDLPLETWVGPAYLADLRGSDADRMIDASTLAEALRHVEEGGLRDAIVLLATGFDRKRASDDRWYYHSAHLAPDGARWLVDRGVRAVGIDHYSIGGSGAGNVDTHAVLLGGGAWIVEDLYFPDELWSLPQPVKFWSLPIHIAGSSGAFCRPVVEVHESPEARR